VASGRRHDIAGALPRGSRAGGDRPAGQPGAEQTAAAAAGTCGAKTPAA